MEVTGSSPVCSRSPDPLKNKGIRLFYVQKIARNSCRKTLFGGILGESRRRKYWFSGLIPPSFGEKMSFRDFAHNHWLPEWADTHLTEAVKESYCRILTKNYYPLFGNKNISDIRAVEIQAMITRLVRRGFSPKTIK